MTTIQTISNPSVSSTASIKSASKTVKLFEEMHAKAKSGKALDSNDLTSLITGMTDLTVTNGDIGWLMGKVFDKNGSPAMQNLFTQKLQERNTMAQAISSIWRTIFDTMQSIVRNMR